MLALCISPVAAVTGDDFEIVTRKDGEYTNYEYHNVNNPVEEYTRIIPGNIKCGWRSFVTFKPANIEGAPVMVVDTNGKREIYLPYHSVDEWEIKFYCCKNPIDQPDDKYLKNAGVVNVKEVFGEYLPRGLDLVLSWAQMLYTSACHYNDEGYVVKPAWSIPEV